MDKHDEYLINIVQQYLNKENYSLDKQDFKLQLLSNHSYPSVKAITDTLDYFGIENLAAKVPREALEKLPQSFLAVLKQGPQSIIAQVERLKEGIRVYTGEGEKEILSVSDFNESWEGTIVAIEQKKQKTKPLFKLQNSPLPLLFLSGLVLFIISGIFLPETIIYTTIAILGSSLSYFIIREELGLAHAATEKICNSDTLHTNCAGVISSTSSRLFKQIKLSDLSLSFFIFLLVLTPFAGINQAFFFVVSLTAIPFLIYTLYTQGFVLKEWCPLCLGVAGLMLVFILKSFTQGLPSLDLDFVYFTKAILLFSVIYFAWIYLKSLLINTQKLHQSKVDFLRFKRNENLFQALLVNNSFTSLTKLEETSSLVFGKADAPLVITAVTNPLCGYCGAALKTYEKLLHSHENQVQLHLVFNLSTGRMRKVETQIVQKVIELYKQDPSKAFEALKKWFELKSIVPWESLYGLADSSILHTIVEEHSNWCKTHQIFYTPATIIGDHFFPKEYEIEDLTLFIDPLIEQAATSLKTEKVKA